MNSDPLKIFCDPILGHDHRLGNTVLYNILLITPKILRTSCAIG